MSLFLNKISYLDKKEAAAFNKKYTERSPKICVLIKENDGEKNNVK